MFSLRYFFRSCRLAIVFAAGVAVAQEPVSRVLPLPLESVISDALRHNLGLQIDRLDNVISGAEVIEADAAFDTLLFADGSISQSDFKNEGIPVEVTDETGETIVVNRPTSSDRRSYSAGASKRLRMTNASVVLQTRLARTAGSRFDPSTGEQFGGSLTQSADLEISISQPLLRGFGRDIATAPLERARAADRATQHRLRGSALDLIAQVEATYWQLAAAVSRRELRETNRELAESLLEETRERERLGLATRLDLVQAEANLAQREEDILVAEQDVLESRDELLSLLGVLDEALEIEPVFVVEDLPQAPASVPEFAGVWRAALASDYAAAAQEEILNQREIDVRVAEDDRRPELDLVVSGSLGGVSDENAREAYDLALDRDGESWNVNLGFSIPWGRRAANASVRAANARVEQAEWQLLQIKQDLLRRVRSAWREFDIRQKRLDTAELVERLQVETFDRERSRFDEGLSTFRDVLETQRDLDNARLSLLEARVAAIQADLDLDRLRGTLLDRHGLSWADALSQSTFVDPR